LKEGPLPVRPLLDIGRPEKTAILNTVRLLWPQETVGRKDHDD
jgi:hypothetical protein